MPESPVYDIDADPAGYERTWRFRPRPESILAVPYPHEGEAVARMPAVERRVLAETYTPQPIWHKEGQFVEFVTRDEPTVSHEIAPGFDVLLSMKSRRIIGARIALPADLRTTTATSGGD